MEIKIVVEELKKDYGPKYKEREKKEYFDLTLSKAEEESIIMQVGYISFRLRPEDIKALTAGINLLQYNSDQEEIFKIEKRTTWIVDKEEE
jgi:site-specific recombinase